MARQKGVVTEAGTFAGIIQQRNSHESGKMQDTSAWCGTFIFKEVFLVVVVEAGKGGYY